MAWFFHPNQLRFDVPVFSVWRFFVFGVGVQIFSDGRDADVRLQREVYGMTVQYVEKSVPRTLTVMDAAGDFGPFFEVGRNAGTAPIADGHIRTARTERRNERIRVFIRRIDETGVVKVESPPRPGTSVTGPWAVAAGIPQAVGNVPLYQVNERMLLPVIEKIDAGFEILFKRFAWMDDSEAQVVCEYRQNRFQGAVSISDETEWQGGQGLFAARVSTWVSGTYAVELCLDDENS